MHDGMLLIRREDRSYARAWALPVPGNWAVTKGVGPDSVKTLVLWQVPSGVIQEYYTTPNWQPVDGMAVIDLHSKSPCRLKQVEGGWAIRHARWDVACLDLDKLRDRVEPA